MIRKAGFLALLVFVISFTAQAGKKDSTRVAPDPILRNVIKYNPTPKLLWQKANWTFSYERVLGNKQSFTVQLGYLVFGELFKDTIAQTVNITDRWKQGINFSFDYRFYLTRRNTRPIPDGLYIGPYLSFYGYKFGNGFDVIQTPGDDFARLNAQFYFINLGGELGYQFVFWKRFTIDLILLGPSISYYGGKINVVGEVDWEDVNNDIYEKLKEKYPKIDEVVFDEEFRKKGTLDVTSFGLRYSVQFGFHF